MRQARKCASPPAAQDAVVAACMAPSLLATEVVDLPTKPDLVVSFPLVVEMAVDGDPVIVVVVVVVMVAGSM